MGTRVQNILFVAVFVSFLLLGCPHGPADLEFQTFRSFGGSGSGSEQLNNPRGIAERRLHDSLGTYIFIADYGNDRVSVWRFGDLAFIRSFGASGNQPGEFSGPVNLTVTQSVSRVQNFNPPINPMIYVTDSKNNRIQKFDINGNFLLEWGSQGTLPGEFNTPMGIDIDFEGNIFVADWGNNRIQVFDTLGNLVGGWGQKGTGPDEFDGPVDIAVGFDEREPRKFAFVAVADKGNDRVQLFDRQGKLLRSITGVKNIQGIDIVYFTRSFGRRLVVITSSPATMSLFRSPDYNLDEKHRLSGTAEPYDVTEFIVTDTAGGTVIEYGWGP